MARHYLTVFLCFYLFMAAVIPAVLADEWAYLDNGTIRIGVKKSSGACIGYFAQSNAKQNLLNHYDQGRFVQQSYYGDEDGSKWVTQPWRYNPVQGGEYRGNPAALQEFKVEENKLYSKTTPRNWAGGELLPEVVMEQWIELKGPLAHVRFKMTYSGTKEHKPRHQELPAIFTEPHLATLVTYEGDRPWNNEPLARKRPGWPNQSQKLSENWVAYVDDKDFGIGAYVPVATDATCYRYQGGGNSNCSYVAPLATFALKPGLVWEYYLYLTIGSSQEIRQRFYQLRQGK